MVRTGCDLQWLALGREPGEGCTGVGVNGTTVPASPSRSSTPQHLPSAWDSEMSDLFLVCFIGSL